MRRHGAGKETWSNKFVADATNNNFDHVGTLKYQSFTTHRYTPSTCQIYHKWIVHEHECLSSFLFFRLQSFLYWEKERERERERGYIKLGIRRTGLKVYLSFFFFRRSSCGEYFLFYGLIDFMLFLVLAWRNGSFVSEIFFSSSFTRSTWLWFRPPRTLSNNYFSLFLFSPTGRRCHFRFRVPANPLASTLFLPVSGDSLGLLDVTPYPILYPSCHQVQTSVFPFWLGFVTLGLTHIPLMS